MRRRSGARRALATLLLAGLTAGGTVACSGEPAQDDSTSVESVTASFTAYAAAVNAKDGDRSADLMSSSSQAYYDHLRDLAVDADQKALAKEGLIDQITVLSMRSTLSAQVLRTADARSLVSTAVTQNLISQNSAAPQGLQQVQIKGTRATAQLVVGAGTQYPVSFVYEKDRWRFDVTSLLAPAESAIQQAATTQKLSDRALVDQVMITRVGAAKAKTLWTPIGRG
jgi:hypothetical protein